MWFYRTLCWLNAFCEFCPPSAADSTRFCPPSAEGMHSATTFYCRTFFPSLNKNKMLIKEFTGRVAALYWSYIWLSVTILLVGRFFEETIHFSLWIPYQITNMKTLEKEYKANAIHGRLFLSICILRPPFTTLPL